MRKKDANKKSQTSKSKMQKNEKQNKRVALATVVRSNFRILKGKVGNDSVH